MVCRARLVGRGVNSIRYVGTQLIDPQPAVYVTGMVLVVQLTRL